MMRVRPLDLKFLNELAAMMRARRGEMRVPGVRGLRPWRRLGASVLRGSRRPVLIVFHPR
jgi:hypothetical protein